MPPCPRTAVSSLRRLGGCIRSSAPSIQSCSTIAACIPVRGLENQEIKSKSRLNGAGLRYLAVEHEGNQRSSREEADRIRNLVSEIVAGETTWVNRPGVEASVGLEEVLIIAPYNAQVFELQERFPGARIGTVDKFQGREAPIVIYSMTTSCHADAPRGMELLYCANRLNVATSRA